MQNIVFLSYFFIKNKAIPKENSLQMEWKVVKEMDFYKELFYQILHFLANFFTKKIDFLFEFGQN